ncbi:phosphatase PAP2 family protein [Aurantimonas manganoxydans]|nr:phosphatase PAP2 family protein [Aurantimonas manganoxydans]
MAHLAGDDGRCTSSSVFEKATKQPQTGQQHIPAGRLQIGTAGHHPGIAGDIARNSWSGESLFRRSHGGEGSPHASQCDQLVRCSISAASSSTLQGSNLQVFCKLASACAAAMSAPPSSPVSSRAKSDRLIIAFLIAILVASMFFWMFPGLDLVVSRWFFSPGDGFTSPSNSKLQWLRRSSRWALAGVIVVILLRILRDTINGALTWSRVRKPIWLLAGLALGPGLLVNGLLKGHWGRPRPINVDVFGGDAVHQTVWVISDWCDRNCSFVSGEASSSAWLVAAALVTPKPVRLAATAATLVYAGALSLNRIAFGGHFLSDVVLAWLICGLVFAILDRLIPGTAYPFRPGSNHT